jgi:DNA-binding NarL/FixJ family response regulator
VRLLLVDDDTRFLDAVEALLETLGGVEVVGRATDGDAAFEAAARLRPDVIVMDFDMPRVDGVEATRRIRDMVPGIDIVILSGSDVVAHAADAHAAGAIAYLRKANTITDLPAILKALQDEVSGKG